MPLVVIYKSCAWEIISWNINVSLSVVYTEKKLVLIVNEEGLIISLPVNQMASEIANQVVVGDVIEVPELEFQKLA